MTSAAADKPVAIVTGAAGGIGAACAGHLAAAGYNIAANYRSNEEGAASVVSACREQGVDAVAVAGDVALNEDCAATVEAAVSRWSRIDTLVNNAGITKFVAPDDFDALDPVDFERIFATNLTGAWLMSRTARPHLEAAPHAAIVNISSHAGISGIGSSIAYSASKGALNVLTLGLARTLAPAIRVDAVCPGYVTTDWARQQHADDASLAAFRQKVVDLTPLKRATTANDVAEAVTWLATGAAAITGILLVIDGGTHLAIASPMKSSV